MSEDHVFLQVKAAGALARKNLDEIHVMEYRLAGETSAWTEESWCWVWMDEMDGMAHMDQMDGSRRALLEGASIQSIKSMKSI